MSLVEARLDGYRPSMRPQRRTAAVIGGSVAGSATALLLARAGWQVTLVDPGLPVLLEPGDTPSSRPGAPHTVQAHGFGSRTGFELRSRLPDVWGDLLAAGSHTVGLDRMAPPQLYDGGRSGDADIIALQTRRHLFDHVLASATGPAGVRHRATPAVALLVAQDGPVPRVEGVVLADGHHLPVEVVVDAAGRRSPVTGWLHDQGIDQPERTDRSIARYYSRHYRVEGEQPAPNVGFAEIHGFACHVQLLFPGDRDTAVIALAAHDRDPVLKALRHPPAFDALLAANRDFAAWCQVLRPTSDVYCLGAFDNRSRSLVRDGRPLVRGLHQVGDSLAMTNPTRGRGVSMGLMAAGRLTDVLLAHDERDGHDDRSLAFEEWRVRSLLPHYRECATTDTVAAAQLQAALEGRPVPGNAPDVQLPEDHPITAQQLDRAAGLDPDLFRIAVRAEVMLDDERHVESAEVAARVLEVLAEAGDPPAATNAPPPARELDDRAFLARLLPPYS